jgi:hypothetical protein
VDGRHVVRFLHTQGSTTWIYIDTLSGIRSRDTSVRAVQNRTRFRTRYHRDQLDDIINTSEMEEETKEDHVKDCEINSERNP